MSESAHLIWRLRNERVIGDRGEATEPEIRNRWKKAINSRLHLDCVLTNEARYGKKAMDKSLVRGTWKKVLKDEDRLPRTWFRETGVLGGCRLMTGCGETSLLVLPRSLSISKHNPVRDRVPQERGAPRARNAQGPLLTARHSLSSPPAHHAARHTRLLSARLAASRCQLPSLACLPLPPLAAGHLCRRWQVAHRVSLIF